MERRFNYLDLDMYRRILVAYDGTPESRFALDECVRLAPDFSTKIHLLVVLHLAPFLTAGGFVAETAISAEKDRMEQELIAGHAFLSAAGLNVIDHLEVGEPVNVIAELANSMNVELVIIGHSRQTPLAMRWWRGSVDSLLIEKIRCSLLIASAPSTVKSA
jgi:nucleotide-binding universal stress UspA family protein